MVRERDAAATRTSLARFRVESLVRFVDRYSAEHHGRAPTVREIAANLGLAGGSVQVWVHRAVGEGLLVRDNTGRSRNLRLPLSHQDALQQAVNELMAAHRAGVGVDEAFARWSYLES